VRFAPVDLRAEFIAGQQLIQRFGCGATGQRRENLPRAATASRAIDTTRSAEARTASGTPGETTMVGFTGVIRLFRLCAPCPAWLLESAARASGGHRAP
jgi:hypothetical protein